MRKQQMAIFLPLLVSTLLAAGQAQSTSAGTAQHTALQKVEVTPGDDGLNVQISTRNPVTPVVSTLQAPERVVIALPATVMATTQHHIDVDSHGVKDVRIGMDAQTPPTTSVVVDLSQPSQYELVPNGPNKFTLKLHTGATAPSTASATAKTVFPAATPVAKAMASKPSAINQTVFATAKTSETTVPAATQTASATPFVFVEPSYKPKDKDAATSDSRN
jgi:hypothetical protein